MTAGRVEPSHLPLIPLIRMASGIPSEDVFPPAGSSNSTQIRESLFFFFTEKQTKFSDEASAAKPLSGPERSARAKRARHASLASVRERGKGH